MSTLLLTLNAIATLSRAVTIQHDIASDTVTDDLHISGDGAISASQLAVLRKSTDERIDILMMLTHINAALQTSIGSIEISAKDKRLLRRELDCYLCMITDMVEEDDGTLLSNRIQHIVNINMLILQLK